MKLGRRRFLRLAAAGAAVLCSYPLLIERYVVLTNRYRVHVPGLPDAFTGFTLVQLTDIHYGPLVPLAIVRSVIRRCNNLAKDIVVCTGDYVHTHNTVREIDTVWPEMAMLRCAGGVYSILGNHDHWADTNRSQYWLDTTGQNLRRRVVPLERNGARIWLAGAGDLWEDHVPIDELLRNVPKNECRIVLAHNPDTADTGYSERVDLMISGHTHGGQVRIPFMGTPILPVKNKNYSNGLKQSPRGIRVFISKGIGWAVYPVRFNCFPEIAVLELVP